MIDHFLEQAIVSIDTTLIRNWTAPLYIRRNFLYALWHVSYRPNSNPVDKHYIPRDQVLRIVGEGYANDVDELVNDELHQFVQATIIDGRPVYAIAPDDLANIHFVFNTYYQVARERQPYLNMSAHTYTNALFRSDSKLRPTLTSASQQIFNGSQNAGSVNITPGPEDSIFLDYNEDGETPWKALVFVCPHDRALSLEQMYALCGQINDVRTEYMELYNKDVSNFPALLIAPPGSNFQAFRVPNSNPYTYHLTPLSSQRLFQKLESDIFGGGWNHSEVAASFPAIFPFANGPLSPLSELRAVERLKTALQQKKSIS